MSLHWPLSDSCPCSLHALHITAVLTSVSTVRLQVRLSIQFTKIHLWIPILSLFRIYNVISVHCEPRKGADRQGFEKQTRNAMSLIQKKIMPRERLLNILHYFTVLKGSGSRCTEEKAFPDSSRRSGISVGHAFSLPFFLHTHTHT